MYAAGGLAVVWRKLADRFPLKPRMDEKGEVLDAVFVLAPSTAEMTVGYLGRVKAVFARCTAVIVALDEEVQGYFLSRPTRLSLEQKALVLNLAKGEWEITDIAAALRSAFHQKLPAPTRTRGVSFQDPGGDDHHGHDGSTQGDGAAVFMLETQTAHCVMLLCNLADNPEAEDVDEQVVVDGYATWQKAAREGLNKTRLQRGFPRGVPPPSKVLRKVTC